MPYKTPSDLPEHVQHVLPIGAQKVYLKAFNSAYVEYKDKVDQEIISHRVAWATVKKKYEKTLEGKWTKKKQSK